MIELTSLESTWDVIVVGAGPAGSAAAIGAARQGLRVLQVDSKTFPRPKVCGGCLNQVSIDLLRRLIGQRHDVWSQARPLNHLQIYARSGQLKLATPPGRSIDRAVLDQALVNYAQESGVVFLAPAMATLGDLNPDSRTVGLRQGGKSRQLQASVVVLATGLGKQRQTSERIAQVAAGNSRLGVAMTLPEPTVELAADGIHMAVGKHGYVGMTQTTGRQLHVAAAIDRTPLQRLGPQAAVDSILAEAGGPRLEIEPVLCHGTPPLTARATKLGSQRAFLVGDAASYIEPFTGEGIAWALKSGSGVVPLVKLAVDRWQDRLIEDWESWHRSHIVSRQSVCQQISFGLKHPLMRWLAYQTIRWQPRVAQHFIQRINHISTADLESPIS